MNYTISVQNEVIQFSVQPERDDADHIDLLLDLMVSFSLPITVWEDPARRLSWLSLIRKKLRSMGVRVGKLQEFTANALEHDGETFTDRPQTVYTTKLHSWVDENGYEHETQKVVTR